MMPRSRDDAHAIRPPRDTFPLIFMMPRAMRQRCKEVCRAMIYATLLLQSTDFRRFLRCCDELLLLLAAMGILMRSRCFYITRASPINAQMKLNVAMKSF